LSVEGLGGFYISSRVVEEIHPAVVGWDSVVNARDYMTYDFTLRPGAQRFEEGSFNTLSIHAFGAALELLAEEGIANIEKRVLHLGDCILERLRERNLKIFSAVEPSERSGIVAFTGKVDLDALAGFMAERGVFWTVRDGLMRLSPHFYNTEDEVDRFFAHFDEFKKK